MKSKDISLIVGGFLILIGLVLLMQALNDLGMLVLLVVLTLVATIFIPLTFIAGIYGMNFEYMPELGYRYGYFAVWIAMIVVAIGMLVYFKRRKWL